jgi:hypothetical protein
MRRRVRLDQTRARLERWRAQHGGRYDVTLLQARVAAWSPAAEDFATKLRRHKRTPGPELDHILKLQVGWSIDDIVAAIAHAVKYDAFDARAVERIQTS